MTREEAIQWLKNEKWENANNKYKKEWNEAFDMAIEALSAAELKQEFGTADAEQVTSKLKKPCDSLLTDDSAERKEQKSKLESADAEPKWNCTANFVAEQLDRLRNMTDEEKWEFFKRFFGMKGGAE